MSGHLKRLTDSVAHNSKDRSLDIYTSPKYRLVTVTLVAALIFGGCTVGPKYQKPAAQAPQAYKELTPADFSKTDGWKVAQPQDAVLHGKWWELFNDPELNALEDQVNISNQNIKSASGELFRGPSSGEAGAGAILPYGYGGSLNHDQSTTRGIRVCPRRPPAREPRRSSIFRLTPPGCRICGAGFAIRCARRPPPRRPAKQTWKMSGSRLTPKWPRIISSFAGRTT